MMLKKGANQNNEETTENKNVEEKIWPEGENDEEEKNDGGGQNLYNFDVAQMLVFPQVWFKPHVACLENQTYRSFEPIGPLTLNACKTSATDCKCTKRTKNVHISSMWSLKDTFWRNSWMGELNSLFGWSGMVLRGLVHKNIA